MCACGSETEASGAGEESGEGTFVQAQKIVAYVC